MTWQEKSRRAGGGGVEANADVDDAPIVRYVQKLLLDAINGGRRTSIRALREILPGRYRTDGVLQEAGQPPFAIKERLLHASRVISGLDISERRCRKMANEASPSANRAIDFRVSTLPTLFGEKICMRILDPSSQHWD